MKFGSIDNRGSMVAQAVHAAKMEARSAGQKIGPAVSQAARGVVWPPVEQPEVEPAQEVTMPADEGLAEPDPTLDLLA